MRANSSTSLAGPRGWSIWQVVVPWRTFAAIAGSLPLAGVLLARLGS